MNEEQKDPAEMDGFELISTGHCPNCREKIGEKFAVNPHFDGSYTYSCQEK